MDKRIQLDAQLLRGKFILPQDVTFLSVADIDDKTKGRLGELNESDVAITRASARVASKIVNHDFASLIEEFHEANSLAYAIAQYAKKNPANDSPETMLEEALPMFIDLVNQSILVPESEAENTINFRLKVGDKIGGLTITRQIQLFADTEVYQAIGDSHQFFAVKLLRPDSSTLIREKLSTEKELLNQTAAYWGYTPVIEGTFQKNNWIASHWFSGSSISKVAAELTRAGNWLELQGILADLAERFASLHEQKIIHGDIHPNNILVDADNAPHIIDLGNAYHLDNKLVRFQRCGVAFYYEPEFAQAMLNKQPPPRANQLSEQFSIAALIFHLVTGNYYDDFELEQNAMYQAIANAKPKSLIQQGGPDWQEMEVCLKKALSTDANNRYASMREFATAIRQCELPSNLLQYQDKTESTHFFSHLSRDTLDFLYSKNTLYKEGLPHGPLCSVNGGAAGIAYSLLKVACAEANPQLYNEARLWLNRAQQQANDPKLKDIAYKNINHKEEFAMVGECSTHHGVAGIAFVSAIIALAGNDYTAADKALADFFNDIHLPSESRDATIGKLSGVLSLCEIFEYFNSSLTEEILAGFSERIESVLKDIWLEIDDIEHINDNTQWKNLGFAHGWAGLLYASLLWHMRTKAELPDKFMMRLEQLVSCLYPEGRGRFVYWKNDQNSDLGVMSGWCNGSAGLIYLFCLLYQYDKNPRWKAFAEQLGWHTWEDNNGPVDLCCGVAGRAFSLIHLSQIAESSHWLNKASQLISGAWEMSVAIDDEEHEPHHLFKGHLGLILAAKALEKPDLVSMPMMGMA